MKKLITILAIVLLAASSARIIEVADAGITDKLKAVIAARNTPAGGPYVCSGGTADSVTDTNSPETLMAAGVSGREYFASPYTVDGSDITVCSFEFPNTDGSVTDTARIFRGSYSGAVTIHMEIRENNASGCGGKDCPGDLIASNSTSAEVSVQTGLPTTPDGTNVSFAWSSPNYPTLSSGTKYWFTLKVSGEVANYIYWGASDTSCAWWYATTPGSWTEHVNPYCGTFIMKE